jgi:hypothetical protein
MIRYCHRRGAFNFSVILQLLRQLTFFSANKVGSY